MAIYVSKGETSTGLDVSYDSMFILKGGTAKKTRLNDEGDMYVSNGGTAIETEINEYGHMFVSKGGTVKQTTVTPYGWMYVSNGGTASDTTVNERGNLHVSKGAKAFNTTVNQSGLMYISGGTVSGVNVNFSGYFCLGGGTINGLSLDRASGCVSSGGGTINDLTMSGGYISFYSGTINRATVDHGDIYCYSGGKINSATFNGGRLTVSSNCTANKITLENSAHMDVYQSKSKASGITVRTGGSMYIGSGAVVSNITFLGGISDPSKDQYAGRLAAYGGTIKGLTIGSGTSIGLFTGCTATKVKWTPGDGVVNIWSASVSFTSKYSGVYLGSNGASVKNTKKFDSETVGNGASAYIAKGGVAGGLTVASGGRVNVWSGGTAKNTTVGYNQTSGYMNVSSGGTAAGVTVLDSGYLSISGGKASGVTVCSGGNMDIYGGSVSGIKVEAGGGLGIASGTATDVEWTPFEGELEVYGGAHITFANEITGVYVGDNGTSQYHTDETLENKTITTGSNTMYVMSGGIVEGTRIETGSMYVFGGSALETHLLDSFNGGYMYLHDGGVAIDTHVSSGGLYVYSGGTADHTTISSGHIDVYSGGIASDTKIISGAMGVWGGSAVNVTVSSGASIHIESGKLNEATVLGGVYHGAAYITASSGAVLSDITLEYGACLYVSKGAKVTNVTSSYGSLIVAEKGATVKITKTIKAESPDSDHSDDTNKENGNGWKDKKKKTVTDAVLNSEALTIKKGMYSSIEFDTNGPMSYDPYNYKNYVGYTDEIDFKKIHLDGTAMLSFEITATEAAKFTIWEWNGSKMVSKQSTSLKEREFSPFKGAVSSLKEYFVETKGIILDGGKDYYLSVESTNASKGGNAYYFVYLDSSDSKFFGTPDKKDDTWQNLSDDYDLGALSGSKDNIVRDWVGYEDAVDYRKFTVEGEKKTLSFHIQSSDLTKFTVWKYDAKREKTVALQTTSIEDNYWGEYQYGTTTDQLQLDTGEYYFSMESTNAKKGGNADYKISVIVGDEYKAALAMPESASDACSLAMPETADSLGMTDSLSLGVW